MCVLANHWCFWIVSDCIEQLEGIKSVNSYCSSYFHGSPKCSANETTCAQENFLPLFNFFVLYTFMRHSHWCLP